MMIKSKGTKKPAKLLDIVLENRSFKELQTSFDKLFFKSLWWYADRKSLAAIKPFSAVKRPRDIQDYMSLSDYKKNIMRSMSQSLKTKQAVIFESKHNGTFGVTVAVIANSKPAGFFGICNLKSKPDSALAGILSGYVKSILEQIRKEAELTRLYELVRPRAIALSTIHTIHRLISSTLDIKELFPRIARLSLQILKAERARICMFNEKTKKLECVTSVDYRKSSDLFKLNTRPTIIENKVFKTGRCAYRDNLLCVLLVDEESCGIIIVRDKVGSEKFTIFDREIITTLAEQAVIAIRNAQLYKEQEDLTAGTIKSLGYLLDAKFPRLYTHTGLFNELILELGREMGLTKKELKILHYSALLPDLGKLVVPTEVLQKKKALNAKERKILKTHTVRGIEVLKYLDVLKPVIPIILHHHEKYNGTGYPDKLKGNRIPLGSRIMAVVDTFEAMICHRPYREQMPFRMAVSEIRRQSGKQFDPAVVDSLVAIAKDGRLEAIVAKCACEFKRPL
jgi:HD-GYP domain-containing protein (c-di-GMP phosphodiesterase class II)